MSTRIPTGERGLLMVDRIAAKSSVDDHGCWIFGGAVATSGYGRVGAWVDGKRATWQMHRVAYEVLVGPIPHGLQIDHNCKNRLCWNPDHLEPVTHRVNSLRSTAPTVLAYHEGRCLRGHSMADAYDSNGKRQCSECARTNARRRYRERRAAA